MDELTKNTWGNESVGKIKFSIQPLLDIHLKSNLRHEIEPNGNIRYVYIFSIVALFILVIATINYMNLSTAYYDTRVVEVGIRKSNGADRSAFFLRFL